MTRYGLSLAEAVKHVPEHPERTAKRSLNWSMEYQVWPNRKAMAKSIRMQQKRASRQGDWAAVVALQDGEGY